MKNFKSVFQEEKPVIAMVHLGALPGTPLYDEDGGLDRILKSAHKDLIALQDAGVDALMFGNENDRPYEFNVDTASTASMAYIIGRLKDDIKIPFGVNVLWDPIATMALAAATGAAFVREIFTGTYASDMGFWAPNAGKALRYRKRLGIDNVITLLMCQLNLRIAWTKDHWQTEQEVQFSHPYLMLFWYLVQLRVRLLN